MTNHSIRASRASRSRLRGTGWAVQIAVITVAAAVVFAGTAACADDSDLPPPATGPTGTVIESPALNLTPEEEEAVAEARATFDAFMNAYIEDAMSGEPYETEMGPVLGGRPLEYATGTLTQELQTEFAESRNVNRVFTGVVEWQFIELDHVELNRSVQSDTLPTVQLVYCIDMSEWTPIERDSGEPLSTPGAKHMRSVEAVYFDDGNGTRRDGWRISEWSEVGDTSAC